MIIESQRPKKQKIKKSATTKTLELIKNPDILAEVAALDSPPITVGFAAETENILSYARKKLVSKNIDIMIANHVGNNLGFDQETNALTILTKKEQEIILSRKNKKLLAFELMQFIANYIT